MTFTNSGAPRVAFTRRPLIVSEVTWWIWVLVEIGGLIAMAITSAVISRRTKHDGQNPDREGAWSLMYYVLVDWWIDWL